jgi:hypothetical protein
METVQDLLPNEHILNFYQGVDSLPEWLGSDLKIILGAGDLDQQGLNVQQFSMFDVFFCEPWDNDGSLRKNIEYLIANYHHQKVICFINIQSSEQIERFCQLFRNRFVLIDGYGGHTPHLSLECIVKTLKPGGTAVNIYEMYETIYNEEELNKLCSTPTEQLKKNDAGIFFSKFRMYIVEDPVNKANIISSYAQCLVSHAWKLSKNSPIHVEWSMLTDMDADQKVLHIKNLIGILLEYDRLPKGLQGKFQRNQRIWNPEREYTELVLTKIAEGGKRKKRSTRRLRKSRSRSKSRVLKSL